MAMENIFVGIDLHKRKFSFVMVSEDGVVLKRGSGETTLGGVSEFAAGLDGRHAVVVEAVDNAFWFVEQVGLTAGSVHVANPYKVRLIASSRLKSDRADARILADLLRVGYLPEVYIPSEQIRDWRQLVSYRIRLVRDRVRVKNRILTIIGREGQTVAGSDAFGRMGRRQMERLDVTPAARQMVTVFLTHHDLLSDQIKALDGEIAKQGADDPVVQRLRTIDGVETFTALAIRAAVGEMSRFGSAKSFAAYTGLIPGYRQSADTIHTGGITKQGVTTLRWLLIQAVPHAVRKSAFLKRLYRRICFRSSVGHAKVAVAHALARIIFHVWMEARPYYR
jgi:transposase